MKDELLLKKLFPTAISAAVEIINLNAISNLPKGTEHFLSDLHGENETFSHILRNASGVIKHKIIDVFKNTLSNKEMNELATLIYYPTERLKIIKKTQTNMWEWYRLILLRLVEIARIVSSKYTRSKVRKAMPSEFEYILDELILNPQHNEYKEDYYNKIISSIIDLNQADNFIVAICNLIQRLAIDKLHILGDIFDRGSGSDVIMDTLLAYHSVDIQWGNHDILWLGGFNGNSACIANIIRINCLYNNLHIIESGYGINLRPLAIYASEKYDYDENFKVNPAENTFHNADDGILLAKIHKAITIIQLKLESKLILEHSEYNMDDRQLLSSINIDPELSEQEALIVEQLVDSFTSSLRLKKHCEFLLKNGSLYLAYNGNLLFHGCIPCDDNGEFSLVEINGKKYCGKPLLDVIDNLVRTAKTSKNNLDYLWYLWCGKNSPLYGRDYMLTFEKYFDKNTTLLESKNPYYKFIKNEDFCDKIIREFGLDTSTCHIINGHMPVKVKDGENPVSANGKHITIDGGLSKPFHKKTGISGYTLISNSVGLILVSHAPFVSSQDAINNAADIASSSETIQQYKTRVKVKDTDIGKSIKEQIETLTTLINTAY